MAPACLCPCPNTHPQLSWSQRGPAGSCSQPWLCRPNAQHTCQPGTEDRGSQEEWHGDGPYLGSWIALGVPRGLAVIQSQCREGTRLSLRAELGLEPSLHQLMRLRGRGGRMKLGRWWAGHAMLCQQRGQECRGIHGARQGRTGQPKISHLLWHLRMGDSRA